MNFFNYLFYFIWLQGESNSENLYKKVKNIQKIVQVVEPGTSKQQVEDEKGKVEQKDLIDSLKEKQIDKKIKNEHETRQK